MRAKNEGKKTRAKNRARARAKPQTTILPRIEDPESSRFKV